MDREARAMVGRLKSEREFAAWAVWTNARLSRAEKFPELKEFMRMARGEKKREQTPEEMIAIAMRWQKVVRQL
jgi:hypothetical protein